MPTARLGERKDVSTVLLLAAALVVPNVLAAEREMDADMLAAVAVAEDHRAPSAVMWTVRNRARRSGRTLLEVVAAPRQFHGWVRGRDPRHRWRNRWERRRMAQMRELAYRVMGGQVRDPTRDATHFHAAKSRAPRWAPRKHRWVVLGGTAFYKVGR
jgi:spore germination cell wall hydrolase CwlJ-like protein